MSSFILFSSIPLVRLSQSISSSLSFLSFPFLHSLFSWLFPVCSYNCRLRNILRLNYPSSVWSQPRIKAFRFGFMSAILFIAAHFFQSGSIINRNRIRNNLVISFIKKLSFLLDFFTDNNMFWHVQERKTD